MKVGGPQEEQQKRILLDRLVKVLDTPLANGGGTINVLRNGFASAPARFAMSEPKPESTKNPATVARHDAVRLRVMRQVHFSTADQRSIDLVFFVNGIPVATAELKTDFTQSVAEAIEQYKKDRLPKDKGTGRVQPLLGFGNRAVVHFAVSNDEVWMTTRLQGDDTYFLPFNMGDRRRLREPDRTRAGLRRPTSGSACSSGSRGSTSCTGSCSSMASGSSSRASTSGRRSRSWSGLPPRRGLETST